MSSTELQRLQQKVEEQTLSLKKAAQYGLQLLDDKVDLQNKLEEQRIEMIAVIEGLEQEKCSLQREVELKCCMLESLQSELDTVKKQQKHFLEQQQEVLERNHTMQLNALKNKAEKLKADLDEAQLLEKQLKHKLDLRSQTLSNKTEELRQLTERAHETMSSDFLELQVQKMDLESSMAFLKQEHQELQYKEQQLQLANSTLQRQLESLQDTKEEMEKEVVSLYNALEKSREAIQELQIQLDQVLQQAQDPNSKGNSLFAEVEDKRAEMERQLISLKVQFQSLQKQHAFSRQQMLRMKVQISNLMQLQGTRADPAQLERLQFMLSEKNSEIETLMRKVQQLEKMTGDKPSSTGMFNENEFVDETYYTDLLKMQLSNSKKDSEKLKDELSMARMKALSESHRVLALERKLFVAENALKQGQSERIELQVEIEELQMKYEPYEVNKARAQKRKREKFPVAEAKSGPSSTEIPALGSELQKTIDKDAVSLSCSAENSVLTPVESAPNSSQHPNSSPHLLSDTKCARICEVASISVSDPLRYPMDDCKQKRLTADENLKAERSKKNQDPLYVDTKNTMERQCAQQ